MTVKLVVPEEDTRFVVEDPTDEVDDVLVEELKYWNDAYKEYNRRWVYLYSRSTHAGPVGLIDRAERVLEENGFTVDVEIKGDRRGDFVELNWLFPHDLRPYQKEAVTAVLENRGGIVGLPTGMGKTVVAMRLLYQLSQSAGRGIVLVHTQELMYQWAEELEKTLGVEPGLIGDGHWSEGPVTVAIMQTLISRGADSLSEDYGVAVYDECHRTSAAETMHDVSMDVDTDYRIGLSATPWRRIEGEELKIEGAVGGNVYSMDAEDGIRKGHLAKPVFEVLTHPGPQAQKGEKYHDAYRRCIEHSGIRNGAIISKAIDLAENGYKVLVNVNRVDQGDYIASVTEEHGTDAEFLSGSDGTERRQSVLDEFENGDLNVLVSTLIKEGNDIPAMSAIVLAQATKSDIETIQVIGRALRPSNGDHARIVDVKDEGIYFGSAFRERQDTMAEYYGSYYDLPYGSAPDSSTDEQHEQQSLTEPLTEEEEQDIMDSFGL